MQLSLCSTSYHNLLLMKSAKRQPRIHTKSNLFYKSSHHAPFRCELLILFQNLLTTPSSFSTGPHTSSPPKGPFASFLLVDDTSDPRGISSPSGLRFRTPCQPYSTLSSALKSGRVKVIRNVISRLPVTDCAYDSVCLCRTGFLIPRWEKSSEGRLDLEES